MGSTISETRFNTIIMSSLPESYQPSLQTITAAERINKLSGRQSAGMKANDLMAFLIKEAQNRLINKQHGKNTELALAAYSKLSGKSKSAKKDKSDKAKSDMECGNCKQKGHVNDNCYAKGGGKEGQAPWQNKGKQKEAANIAEAKDEEEPLPVLPTSQMLRQPYQSQNLHLVPVLTAELATITCQIGPNSLITRRSTEIYLQPMAML